VDMSRPIIPLAAAACASACSDGGEGISNTALEGQRATNNAGSMPKAPWPALSS
jgi:hypothetical protein